MGLPAFVYSIGRDVQAFYLHHWPVVPIQEQASVSSYVHARLFPTIDPLIVGLVLCVLCPLLFCLVRCCSCCSSRSKPVKALLIGLSLLFLVVVAVLVMGGSRGGRMGAAAGRRPLRLGPVEQEEPELVAQGEVLERRRSLGVPRPWGRRPPGPPL